MIHEKKNINFKVTFEEFSFLHNNMMNDTHAHTHTHRHTIMMMMMMNKLTIYKFVLLEFENKSVHSSHVL